MGGLRVLLLQARNVGDHAREEERQSFADRSGLTLDNFVAYDLLEGPPSLKLVRECDALMVGGSGDYYVSKGNLPGFGGLLDVLTEVVEVSHPVFASCFGFQLLVQALGGEVVLDADNTEVGTYELTLTDAGAKDEVLGILPRKFLAQLGRKDRAKRLPEGCSHLASSRRAPYQALRLPGKPIWATQFHPELNRHENRARFDRYLEGYAQYMEPEEQQRTLSRFRESPEAEGLIPRFLQVVFG